MHSLTMAHDTGHYKCRLRCKSKVHPTDQRQLITACERRLIGDIVPYFSACACPLQAVQLAGICVVEVGLGRMMPYDPAIP